MKARYFILAIGSAALLVLALRDRDQGAPPATVIPLETTALVASSLREPADSTMATIAENSNEAKATPAAKEWKPSPLPPLSPSTREKLKEFSRLKKKVFLDNDDKRELSDLTRDPNFLSSLAPMFNVSFDRHDETELNAAIDLLLDAATKEHSETAQSVLMGVIADPAVEDAAVPAKLREEVAGIKGEIMFLWTAAQPERANHMASMLPGPVSQKVWENVLDAQERNRSESLAAGHDD